VVRQVKKRGAQFHELCFLFSRQNDVLQMSRRCIQFRTFDQLVDLRIEAYDEVQDSSV